MIVRVLEGRVRPGQVNVFRAQAQTAIRDAREHGGLVYAHVGRQAHFDGGEQVVFISVWRDLDALYGWLGSTDLLATPVLMSGGDVFERFEVQHYEVIEPAESEAPAIVVASPEPTSSDAAVA